jgi:hypothetical protein
VQLFKIYVCLSGLVGLLQIVAGMVLGSAPSFTPSFSKLFTFYGYFGAYGVLELTWLGLSIIAAVFCIKKNLPFLPQLLFIAFCLLHPLIGVMVPATAFDSNSASEVGRFIPAVFEMFFGIAYLVINVTCYKSYFFVPRLFEK